MSSIGLFGLLMFVGGGLWLLIVAFCEKFWWGLFCFFFPPMQFLFVLLHWSKAKRPLLVQLLGIVIVAATTLRSNDFNYTHFQQTITQYKQLLHRDVAKGSSPQEQVPEYSPDDPVIIGNTQTLEASKSGVIYKCTDAEGHVTFTQKKCSGAGDVIDNLPPVNAIPSQDTTDERQADAGQNVERIQKNSVYTCDGRTRCSQMTSCDEAMYFLRHCPDVQMDGGGDGVPCESQWCEQ
jgi:hypothetical protein